MSLEATATRTAMVIRKYVLLLLLLLIELFTSAVLLGARMRSAVPVDGVCGSPCCNIRRVTTVTTAARGVGCGTAGQLEFVARVLTASDGENSQTCSWLRLLLLTFATEATRTSTSGRRIAQAKLTRRAKRELTMPVNVAPSPSLPASAMSNDASTAAERSGKLDSGDSDGAAESGLREIEEDAVRLRLNVPDGESDGATLSACDGLLAPVALRKKIRDELEL